MFSWFGPIVVEPYESVICSGEVFSLRQSRQRPTDRSDYNDFKTVFHLSSQLRNILKLLQSRIFSPSSLNRSVEKYGVVGGGINVVT